MSNQCQCGHPYGDHLPDGRWCAEDDCTCPSYRAPMAAAKADHSKGPRVGICGDVLEPFIQGTSPSVCTLPAGHEGWHGWMRPDWTNYDADLPWLQPATVDPDWLAEARAYEATRDPFTLWDVSAA